MLSVDSVVGKLELCRFLLWSKDIKCIHVLNLSVACRIDHAVVPLIMCTQATAANVMVRSGKAETPCNPRLDMRANMFPL